MLDPIDLTDPSYTPARLLNESAFALRAESLLALARRIEFDPARLHRIRYRKAPVNANLLIAIMDRTGWHVQYVRALAGIPFNGPLVALQTAEEAQVAAAAAKAADAATEAAKPRKRPINVKIEHAGLALTIRGWAEHLGVSERMLWGRKQSGWPVRDIIEGRPKA
jgi:hypothetical protein